MATSNLDREQNINEGLRKLEEFQRRRLQGSHVGHVASRHPATTAATSREPNPIQGSAVRPTPADSGSSPPTVARISSVPTPSEHQTYEFTSKLQAFHELLSSVQMPNDGSREGTIVYDLQRRWFEVMEELAQAHNRRQALQSSLDGLQNAYLQATKTIDLLVAEKSRSKSMLDNIELQLKAKSHEIEVYESEIRGLRERATTNEGQMQALRAECERSQNNSTNSGSLEELALYKKQIEELTEYQNHCSEKLQQMHKSHEQTKAALESTTKELSVAQAYIQQLSGGSEQNTAKEVASNNELDMLREEMRILMSEKSAAELISRNLEASNRGLQERVAKLTHDNYQLTQANRDLVQAPVSTATTEVKKIVETTSAETQCEISSDCENERLKFEADRQATNLQAETAHQMADQYRQQLAILQSQMAMTAEQLQRAKLDSSRACVQNRELKSQLEELQDVFVRLSNEKLELTEQLDAEKHKVQQMENEVQRLRIPIATDADISRQSLESQAAAMWAERYHTLEKQHATCKDIISKLQSKFLSMNSKPMDEQTSGATGDEKGQNESPSVSISEYEFVEQTPEHSLTHPSEHDLDTDNISTSSRDSTSKSRDACQRPSVGRDELQNRFREALQKIVTLEEQKNYLEHQVVQLQMETDTISDYIQLYQQQRAALNRRQQDKEAQMNQLLSDREELRRKVSQLQALVGRLVPVSAADQASKTLTAADVTGDSDLSREVIAREIYSTLEDINQASSSVSFDSFKCTSCHGCQGKLISL